MNKSKKNIKKARIKKEKREREERSNFVMNWLTGFQSNKDTIK